MPPQDSMKHWQRAALIVGCSGLKAAQKSVLHALSHRAQLIDGQYECWPAQPRLAYESGCSERGLRNLLQRLIEQELLTAHHGLRRSTTYRIRFDVMATRQNLPPGKTCHPEESATHPAKLATQPGTDCHPTRQNLPPNDTGTAQRTDQERLNTQPVQKPVKNKRKSKRKPSCMSRAEACAIKPPADLQAALPEYWQAFQKWSMSKCRPGTRWRTEPQQVVDFHLKMMRLHGKGLDVMRGLEDAYAGRWQGIQDSYLKPLRKRRSAAPSAAPAAVDYQARLLAIVTPNQG